VSLPKKGVNKVLETVLPAILMACVFVNEKEYILTKRLSAS